MPIKRQSTTQKVSGWMIAVLNLLIDPLWNECDGFIVRLRGVEVAIVEIRGNSLIPCGKCHPGMKWLHYSEVTIRKGLV